ncbi:somatoliberin [Aulostomus maculatus]
MEKSALLLFCCLVMSSSGSPLYPSIRFGQRDMSILMASSIKGQEDPRHRGDRAESRSVDDPATDPRPDECLGRHADAIFTNSYRKILGQISARKFLQNIMGKRLGGDSESSTKRHSDVYEGTCKEDLTSVWSSQRHRRVPGRWRGSG